LIKLLHLKSYKQAGWIVCIVAYIASACNPTRYVPGDEYLLHSSTIEVNDSSIKKEQLKPYIRQKPNKKILGIRFHLWLYNRSKPNKDNKWNNWLRKNGEEPVMWQQEMTDRTAEQFKTYLQNKGYYYSHITDTVLLKKRKADVIYRVYPGWPYIIGSLKYNISDTTIARLVLADTSKSLIRQGMPFDVSILENERKRIENSLKNRGYFSFTDDYIFPVDADTAKGNRKVGLVINIRPNSERTENNQVIEAPYPLFHIRSLTVNASLSMQNLMNEDGAPPAINDTLTRGAVTFIMPEKFPVKPSVISNSLYIYPDSLYRLSSHRQTYQHLQGLRNFQQVTIKFYEAPGQTGQLERDLDCHISLLPFKRHSYNANLEGTNSNGDLGGAVSLQYQNKSLLGHAEIFDLRLRGMLEAVASEQSGFKTTMEYEAEATLNVPKFIIPVRSNRFISHYNPKTIFAVVYNYRRRPDYTRTVFNTSFGYHWRGTEVTEHTIRPVDINFVELPNISRNFEEILNKFPYLRNSYQSHMVVSSSYSFVRDMQLIDKDNYSYIRINAETAGFLLNSIYKITDQGTEQDEAYKIFGNAFSQFIKSDIDLRYHRTINSNNKIIGRLFVGAGWPYGNSSMTTSHTDDVNGEIKTSVVSMPFEKKYYAGGANSVRGWRIRSLGPGSFVDTASVVTYPNNTGDIKLEVNMEYRFKLVWLMEGALFLDAGNVWDIRKDESRKGAEFRFDRFYREIALSGGLGLRFDFNYFILRADLGMKFYNPGGKGRWTFDRKPNGEKRITNDDFCISIGIGYPF
jgi:outer membrane protein assembly factor BamA